jgi:uncharacterized membrane protein YgdD (TMEM256/DUF423 family)
MVSKGLVGAGGLLGAGGVALSAAAAHLASGPGLGAAAFLLVAHAGALLALAALVRAWPRYTQAIALCAVLLASGATLFALDIALRSLADMRLFPFAAPTGGFAMIGGWLGLTLIALLTRPDRDD